MESDSERASALLAINLKGLGRKKLFDLRIALLQEIVRIAVPGCSLSENKEELVNVLLKYKRSSTKKVRLLACEAEPARPDAPPPSFPSCAPSSSASSVSGEDGPVSSRTRSSVFKTQSSLKLVFFNALKLRVDRPDLLEDWRELFDALAETDMLLMSEVNAGRGLLKKRLVVAIAMLRKASQCNWEVTLSDPSGPGPLEVHALFTRDTVRVLAHHTLFAVGDFKMDHAPLVALVEDLRSKRKLVVTSVHMPPESRRTKRDAQILRLLRCYREKANVRLDTPFTEKGARDAHTDAVGHVIAGDWNTFPGNSIYFADHMGYDVLFGKNTSTTSGGRAFDNILISKDTRHMFTSVSTQVLKLNRMQNSSAGTIAVSDHCPVLLDFAW